MPRERVERLSADDLGIDDGGIDPAAAANDGSGNGDPGGTGGDGGGDRTFDPDRHIGRDRLNADGTFRRKRKGGKRGPNRARASQTLDLTGVSATLLSIHMGAAAVFSQPALALSGDEANALAEAIITLEKQYPTQIDPRAMAWLNLAMVGGMIYGTRLMALRLQNRGARQEAARRAADPMGGVRAGTPQGHAINPANVTPLNVPPEPGFVLTPYQ